MPDSLIWVLWEASRGKHVKPRADLLKSKMVIDQQEYILSYAHSALINSPENQKYYVYVTCLSIFIMYMHPLCMIMK